jgi:hypothetical protein
MQAKQPAKDMEILKLGIKEMKGLVYISTIALLRLSR